MPCRDLFNKYIQTNIVQRKPIMRSTMFAIYTTLDGRIVCSKSISSVYKVISPEALVGEIVRDLICKVYEQGDYIRSFRLVNEKEYLEEREKMKVNG